MQLKLTQQEKVVVQVILGDVIAGTERSKDRHSRRHAQRIRNKFDINPGIINCKINDIITLTNLLKEGITILSKEKPETKEIQDNIFGNILTMRSLHDKFTKVINDKLQKK